MHRDKLAILDFGSQYTQLIARRCRELRVYSEIVAPGIKASDLAARGFKGLVLSGGPDSVYAKGAPQCDPRIFESGLPILGICYGMQLMGQALGGEVKGARSREFGHADLEIQSESRLLQGVSSPTKVWMSHGDSLHRAPPGFSVMGATLVTPIAAIEDSRRRLFGIQFHPEVKHTPEGGKVLANFLDACGFSRDWSPASFVKEAVERVRDTVGPQGRVICAISGGVYSGLVFTITRPALSEPNTTPG
jgi:GMP synthase (glutamine-hydrolysing)